VVEPTEEKILILSQMFIQSSIILLIMPTVHYHAKFGRSRSNVWVLLRRSVWKIWPLVSHLSRSLEVIGINMDWSATYDFLLKVP